VHLINEFWLAAVLLPNDWNRLKFFYKLESISSQNLRGCEIQKNINT
jgi:hypothetical protein